MANGMTGLYVGSSGLRSAQTALNTTAHNLANVNVKGYTRQQVALSSAEYFKIGQTTTQDKSYGVGVDTLAIRRVRDDLIDAAYRQENGRLGYYSTQYDAVVEIESLFGELNGVTFEDSLKDLKNAINELSYEPESTIKRSALIQMSTTFIDRAGSIYKGLKDYQTTLNTKVSNTVDRINELGETISSLNKKITQVELSGERANDLRDQRDKALDELSAYAKVTYQETDNKTLLVTLEGFSFVTSFGVNKMGTEDIDGTGLLRPVWEAFNNRAVFNDFEEITANNKKDIGELKEILLARRNSKEDYTNVGLPFVYENGYYTFDASQDSAYFSGTAAGETNLAWNDAAQMIKSGNRKGFYPFNSGTSVRTPDYHFGMIATIPFSMTADGKISSTSDEDI